MSRTPGIHRAGRDRRPPVTPQPRAADAAAAAAQARQGKPAGRDRRAATDRREPRLVFRFRSPDPVYLPGQGPGLRRAGGSRGIGQGAEGVRQEQRRGAARAALFDIDPTQYRIALAAQPFGLRVGASFGQCLDGVGAGGQGVTAGGRGKPCLRRAGCDAAGTDLRGRSRRALRPPRRRARRPTGSRPKVRRRKPRRICAAPRRQRANAATRTRNC